MKIKNKLIIKLKNILMIKIKNITCIVVIITFFSSLATFLRYCIISKAEKESTFLKKKRKNKK